MPTDTSLTLRPTHSFASCPTDVDILCVPGGYRAATHWASYPMLEAFGVEAVHERVVVDRSRITGDGITAGVDFEQNAMPALRAAVARRHARDRGAGSRIRSG